MDVRGKLVELLKQMGKKEREHGGVTWHDVADHLIANGVTVQEWISVEDRLPQNSTYVNVTTDGVVAQAYWHNGRFFAFTAIGVATVGGVTHWMPLPEPPDMRGDTNGTV